jgi:LysM repeat protein
MENRRSQSPARVLAPLALAVCAVAFFFVIFTSGAGDGDTGGPRTAERTSTSNKRARGERRRPRSSTYVVKTGDTLGSIAERTGVDVETLQDLNPDLDPQALVSGQRIKLRE